ncbi:hypothetical protein OAK19_00145, partial [Aureispira]|nr:hypothetical protein [Aureispira sp.]
LENTCARNPKILITEFLDKLLLRDPKELWDLYLEQGAGYQEFFYKKQHKSKYYKERKEKNLEKRHNEYYLKLLDRGDDGFKVSLLELIFNHFGSQGCFLKKKCPITNTRFHFIDIRQDKFGYDCQISMMRWSDLIFNIIYKYAKKLRNSDQEGLNEDPSIFKFNEDDDERVQILRELRKNLENFFDRFINALKNIIKCFKNTDKIAKQIDNSELRNNIFKYYGSRIKLTITSLKYIYNTIKENKEYFINFFMQATIKDAKLYININKLYMNVIVKNIYGKKYMKLLKALKKYKEINRYKFEYLEDIYNNATILLMDLYFLGRMSRKFYNKSQNNVIVIAGATHIKNYINFLKSSWWVGGPGFKIKWKSKQESEKCLVIPNIFKS